MNTQRMSALERRREFGVMVAIGMRPRRLLGTLTVETTVLGVLGALIGTSFGTALAWYHSTRGFDMSLLCDQANFSYLGVAFSERLLMFLLLPYDSKDLLVTSPTSSLTNVFTVSLAFGAFLALPFIRNWYVARRAAAQSSGAAAR